MHKNEKSISYWVYSPNRIKAVGLAVVVILQIRGVKYTKSLVFPPFQRTIEK